MARQGARGVWHPISGPWDTVCDALGYLRAGLSPANPGWQASHYTLEKFPIAPAPIGTVPLVVGGVGKRRTPHLAGRFADEYNVYPSDVEGMRARIDLAHAAARDAGRDPDDILLSSAGQVLTAATRVEYDEKRAEAAARAGITADELEHMYEERGTPRGTFDEVAALMETYATLGVSRFYLQRSTDFDRDDEAALIVELAAAGR